MNNKTKTWVPTIKEILVAVREHYPDAAIIEVGLRQHRDHAVRHATWNELEWAEDVDLDDIWPLRNVLAKLRELPPQAVRLDLYCYSRGSDGSLIGNADLDIFENAGSSSATVSVYGAWIAETDTLVKHSTPV